MQSSVYKYNTVISILYGKPAGVDFKQKPHREGNKYRWEEVKVYDLCFIMHSAENRKVAVFRWGHFNAAHRLHNPNWTDEQNKTVFGICNNANFHGHNYELVVKVTGEVDPETGFVINLFDLKKIIEGQVEDRFDHKNLNLDCPEFKELLPSAENVCLVIWEILRSHLDKKYQLSVRLYETPRNYVEYPAV